MNLTGGCEIIHTQEQKHLAVSFSPIAFNRIPHQDPTIEATIHETWQGLVEKNSTLFNGAKFRYAGHTTTDTTTTLHLGLTDYKTFSGTHASPECLHIFGQKHMSQPIGNVIIVKTQDDHIALIIRSATSAEGPGALALPGGHPEPSEISPLPSEGDHELVRREMWDGARREVLEELFIHEGQMASVDDMKFLGLIARNRDMKTCMVFYADLYLNADTLLGQYTRSNSGEESEGLLMKPIEELERFRTDGLADGLYQPVPELCGAAELWARVRGGSSV